MESSPPSATAPGITNMPSVYNSEVPAPQTPASSCSDYVDSPYMKSVDGILKPIEMVFSLVTFICATVWWDFVSLGGGWVQFVGMTAFILTTFIYLLHIFKLTPKLSDKVPFKFSEFCYDAIFTLFYFIAGIVSAVNGWRNGAVVAAACFSFFTMVIYGVDSYLRFMEWRHSSEGPYFSSMTSSGSSSNPAQTQY